MDDCSLAASSEHDLTPAELNENPPLSIQKTASKQDTACTGFLESCL